MFQEYLGVRTSQKYLLCLHLSHNLQGIRKTSKSWPDKVYFRIFLKILMHNLSHEKTWNERSCRKPPGIQHTQTKPQSDRQNDSSFSLWLSLVGALASSNACSMTPAIPSGHGCAVFPFENCFQFISPFINSQVFFLILEELYLKYSGQRSSPIL